MTVIKKLMIHILYTLFLFIPLKGLTDTRLPSLKERIGQKIMIGFQGTIESDPEVQEVIGYAKKGLIGGVILFSYNIVSPEQVTALTSALQKNSKYPLIIAVDQEGGKVQRLAARKGFMGYPAAYEVANMLIEEQAYRVYLKMAAELKSVGCTCNLGPVLDLHSATASGNVNPVIGGLNRAYSSDPAVIKKYANTFIRAHKQYGIITALKHYPGHGLASTDSHKGMVDITLTYDEHERCVYRDMLKNEFDGMVMVAHVMHQTIDKKYPATLSKTFIQGWLRNEEKFGGVIISDDIHMGAIQFEFGFEESVVRAVDAGIDILIFSNNPLANGNAPHVIRGVIVVDNAITCIMKALEEGILTESDLNASYSRIMSLKRRYEKPH